jgi:hypothetical protein
MEQLRTAMAAHVDEAKEFAFDVAQDDDWDSPDHRRDVPPWAF